MNKNNFLYFYNRSKKYRNLHKAPQKSVEVNSLYKKICKNEEFTGEEIKKWVILNTDLLMLAKEWIETAEFNLASGNGILEEITNNVKE